MHNIRMKPLFCLALMALALPVSSWALERPCKELLDRVVNLDRKITCDARTGPGASVNDVLERNFLLELHHTSGCYEPRIAARVLESRNRVRCGNASNSNGSY